MILATFLFAWQIYFDFSGYTDLARGVAKMMGYNLSLNFNNPYLAEGLGDFWRRWHISLSSWIRDYIYFPLAGGTIGEPRMAPGDGLGGGGGIRVGAPERLGDDRELVLALELPVRQERFVAQRGAQLAELALQRQALAKGRGVRTGAEEPGKRPCGCHGDQEWKGRNRSAGFLCGPPGRRC
mgnify:CR=1 FL=1